MRTALELCASVLVLACSSSSRGTGRPDSDAATGQDSATAGANSTVTGSVMGTPFGRPVANAYWIGKPSAGSLPTQIFLLGGPLDCPGIGAPLWDKTLGNAPLLELGVRGTAPNTYAIGTDADASYLPDVSGVFNPSADGGMVTISMVNPGLNIVGSYEVHFQGDTLKGTFDATYCGAGVEP
jgi:hypothetical protein